MLAHYANTGDLGAYGRYHTWRTTLLWSCAFESGWGGGGGGGIGLIDHLCVGESCHQPALGCEVQHSLWHTTARRKHESWPRQQ